jgi:hypothetical protein
MDSFNYRAWLFKNDVFVHEISLSISSTSIAHHLHLPVTSFTVQLHPLPLYDSLKDRIPICQSDNMPTNSTDESSTAVTEIAANGDVILIVGPDKRRLQVDSICLKKASKYFRVMFGPHFSEGQDLGGNSPKEVLMLDDNANVLEIICNIIHLRNDAVPEILTPDEVFEIAIAADKFDCGIALKHATALWLNPRDVKGIVELGRLMAAAYMLDNARAFGEITLSMILRHKESYLLLLDETAGIIDFVPWKIFSKC